MILAIVGGTMLTVALTRPRLKWVERLTQGSESQRRWAERGLTALAFVMGGYAWATLFLTLQRQLDGQAAALLKGAGLFLILYAWLIHFEPFANEWRLRGGLGAVVLYSGFAALAFIFGATIAEFARTSVLTMGDLRLIAGAGVIAAMGWVFYRILPWIDSQAASFVDWMVRAIRR